MNGAAAATCAVSCGSASTAGGYPAAVADGIASSRALERSWWLRAPAVLVAPRAVFASLRDDSDEAAEARQEPLAGDRGARGIAAVLVEPDVPAHAERRLRVALARARCSRSSPGALYAVVVFWLGGGLLYGAARRLGSEGSWRRARQTLALAATPLALALLTFWPIRIAVYGEDLFRTGGDDYGRGDAIFGGVYLGFVAWACCCS